ncbi:MAG: phosphatase PAP2 family protein [Halieaceae bacterium]|nr:phosphatase PAP2 family protein [Halieaceae bacterium]
MRSGWNKPIRLASLLLVSTLAACSTTHTDSGKDEEAAVEQIQEIAPGFLQGYLAMEDQLDSKAFVPPAPATDSPRQALDTAWANNMLKLRGTSRWDLARSDADLHFPAAADVFSCALGIPVTEQDTPDLYILLRRTLADVGLASYSAKNAYQRERPFMVNGQPTCTPDEEEALRKDGSYPSGHTSIGWGWGLILSELSPEQTDLIIARARSFGESRNVCNVHWYSDVVAGRMVAAAAVAKLHDNEKFLAAMDAAREDIARARAAGLTPALDCEAQARALATPLQ